MRAITAFLLLIPCLPCNGQMMMGAASGSFDVPPTTSTFTQVTANMRQKIIYKFGTGGGNTITNATQLNASFQPYNDGGAPCTIMGTCPGGAPYCSWCVGGGSQFQPENLEWHYFNFGNTWPGDFTLGSAATNVLFDSSSVILRATLDSRSMATGNIASGQMTSRTTIQPGISGENWRYAIQVTAKIPSGVGFWPAIWYFSRDPNFAFDGSEIDAYEWFQNETNADNGAGCGGGDFDSSKPIPNMHGPGVGTQYFSALDNCGAYLTGVDLGLAYHTYAIVWTRNTVTYYVDGAPAAANYFAWTSDQRAQLIVGFQVGTDLGGIPGVQPTNPAQFPADFHVRDITIWGQ